MARMPRGEPQSVPDPAGDMYDDWVRRKRAAEQLAAARQSENPWLGSPARTEAQDAMSIDTSPPEPDPEQAAEDERIRRLRAAERLAAGQATKNPWLGSPARMEAQDSLATAPDPRDASFFPVVGPLLDAFIDAREGRSSRTMDDVAFAGADLAGADVASDLSKAARMGVLDNIGRRTAEAARKQLRRRGVAGVGQEIHHSVPLNGLGRSVENWRNHPAFLKVLPQANHRRLTGSWAGQPKYDPLRALWVGTPTWMKTVPAWILGRGLPALSQAAQDPGDKQQTLPPPAPYGERPLR